MTLSILSSRDADPNITITLSFNVSFGPPSHIECRRGSNSLFSVKGNHPVITHEVIRSRYISSTEPDKTRVTVRLSSQSNVAETYICTVTVEGRIGGVSGYVTKGTGSSTVMVTGK